MCVIIEQKEGYTLPWEMFETASFNNPHGFGLIIKDPKQKRLQVIQRLNEDPKVIYELLKDNDDCIRYLHLRWKTEGDISEENLHPFCVFHSDARQIYFMHNGTLPYKFKPSNTEKISDSKKFNDEWLVPFLTRLHGHNGKGDYHDPWFIKQLYEVWIGDHNRGLIVANDLEPLFVNDKKWCVIKDNKGQEFYASNDTYFEKLVRGPEFEKRKAAKEAAEKAQKTFQVPKVNSEGIPKIVIPLKDIDLKPIVPLSSDLSDIFEDMDLYSEHGYLSLAAITSSEYDELTLKHPDIAASLLVMITGEYKDLYYEKKSLEKAIKTAKEKGDLKELPKL